jgi:hypothetical protein
MLQASTAQTRIPSYSTREGPGIASQPDKIPGRTRKPPGGGPRRRRPGRGFPGATEKNTGQRENLQAGNTRVVGGRTRDPVVMATVCRCMILRERALREKKERGLKIALSRLSER